MPTTLVTGATGFLAGHCVDQLLKHGHTVIGTVRNPSKTERLAEAFKTEVEAGKLEFETLKDIQDEDEFEAIFKKHPEIDYILHTASPLTFTVDDPEKDMLQPAIRGTTTVLKQAKAHAPNVKKVVITSSLAAMMNPDPNHVHNEQSWNPMTREQAAEKGNPFFNYIGSKLFAEKAGLEFLQNEKPHFSITWINPSYILGPGITLDLGAINASNQLISSVLEAKPDEVVNPQNGSFVDVRDTARAHVVALEPKFDGKRLMLCTAKVCTQDIEDILNKIPALKGKIPVGTPGDREKQLSKSIMDPSETKKLLDFEWIPLDKSVTDFADQWLQIENK
ncbi:putative NADPH-dependent methylglyoxal reductase GRP2 [Yarrowia sp. C11]|nr:putative NADPH-dependent methylglyoxal reductase GRP2 [Yarrowia sp. C11]